VNGWNEQVAQIYHIYRNSFWQWRNSNKTDFFLPNEMCVFRNRFKRSLKLCKRDSDGRLNDKLVTSYEGKCFQKFWKHVRDCDGKSMQQITTELDGVSSESKISGHWAKLYGELFCDNQTDVHKESVQNYIKQNLKCYKYAVNKKVVFSAIEKLKRNKATGSEGLQAEHFQNAGECIIRPMSELISSMISHGFVPDVVMKVMIIPIVKKRGLDPKCSANYRPIAIASTFSKILELALLTKFNNHLKTTDNQFGYKRGVGTELAVYYVRQMAHYYLRHNTPVFLCYLDASKAFDKVNHYTLLHKLCKRNIPAVVVRFLLYWFRSQQFVVKWGQSISCSFPVLNSVRQGGILSAYFFAVYMDDLSIQLTDTQLGCRIGSQIFNHVFYADDVCLLTTSIAALRMLLQICEKYGEGHDLTFNPKKTMCQAFIDYKYGTTRPSIMFCGQNLVWKETVCYLGYEINCGNRDYDELQKRRRELYGRANLLKSRFAACGKSVKIYLFRTFFSSIYCSSLWTPLNKDTLDKVKVAYNDSFRLLMGYSRRCSASKMFAENNVNDFNAMRRVAAYSMLNRLALTENVILSAIVNSKVFTSSSTSKVWKSLLFKAM